MTKHFTTLLLLVILPIALLAQKNVIRGIVTDANSGETLIGATILYGENKGVITDMDGRYYLKVEPGIYHIKVSYVGYLPQEIDITVGKNEITQNFALKTPTLSEVEVIGDVAKTRETPVAFSTVRPIQLQEELASRDIPMILNKTPGVYATQQGGGDGDARINIRGFSQRNLAVMIDGIPVNDMENGWVFWSNWFGLDAVTRNIQVQRGLGASKLALPSVGGTMNIITKGIDANFGGIIKQEFGSDGYLRTSIGVTTGQLKHGWGVTIAGSYKQGNGWVDNTWTKGWFGYIRVDKKLGNHTLTFSAMGAPQQHAQRSYKKSIPTFSKDYAAKLGIRQGMIDSAGGWGIRYNSNWGYLNRWTLGSSGERIYQENPESLSQSLNYYFKPQLSLRDFWRINDKFYLSTILYSSIGNGGGTSFFTSDQNGTPGGSTPSLDPTNGQVAFQTYYDANMTDLKQRSSGILRSSVNNHAWYGLLSTFTWEINNEWTLSGGVDLRTYRAQHYGEIYDLLGGQYFFNNSNKNRYLYSKLYEGDKIYYNNDAKVRWGGVFAQAEWKKEKWSAFLNFTTSLSAYQRIDYFKKMDLIIDGEKFTEAVGYGDIFYYNGSQNLTYTLEDKQYTSHDTVFVIKQQGATTDTLFITNPAAYDINSSQAKCTSTNWKIFPGFTLKGGANYNIDSRNNVYLNLGYLTKAPRFSNVFYNNNMEVQDPKNEIIQAFELGYSFNSKTVSLNVNGYLTKWNNKPLESVAIFTDEKTQETYSYNVNGINAFHKGIEVEFGWKPIPSLQWDQVLAWGDWRWTSGSDVTIYNPAGDSVTSFSFNAKGVHVGNAAQFQFMESLRWEIIKYLYVSGSMTLFGKNYSNMDPASLTPEYMDANGNPPDSWELPVYYLVDLNAGYRFTFKKFKLDIRASVLNLLDRVYISDADNNDSYSTSTSYFDASSAGVFFGAGRTFNTSIALSF
ncbi:MAG: TonB-dependent receptor [Bacteroidales bacterium]|nr:TonB-dependent receptor [Bacteroidales bacterium]MDD4603696.1 TonB-dependent receptor [Bacteroidales bacterium]